MPTKRYLQIPTMKLGFAIPFNFPTSVCFNTTVANCNASQRFSETYKLVDTAASSSHR